MTTKKRNTQRILKLLIGALFVLTFFLINVRENSFGFLIYIVMGSLSVLYYLIWGRVAKVTDLEGLSENWIRNSFIGLVLVVGTVILGGIIPGLGVIGTPTISQSIAQSLGVAGTFMIVVVGASLFESVFIIDAGTDLLNSLLGFPKWLSVIVMAGAGSLFHLFAYGLSLGTAIGSFVSAFVMFALFGLWAEYTNDLAGIITWHGGLNWWIEFGKEIFL